MIYEILFLIFFYLFASLPNAYLISKWIVREDIRKIGREKLSASNVIQNIGFLPGILSGACDVFKGVACVGLAYIFGFSSFFQILSGVIALCGQMWPIFMKFWGGRGGSVVLGVLLFFSVKNGRVEIFLIPLIIWITLIFASKEYGSPIGMIIFLILSMIFGFYFNIEEIYLFSIIAVILIFIQRILGKPGSLKNIKDKKVILWRIFFDRDTLKKTK